MIEIHIVTVTLEISCAYFLQMCTWCPELKFRSGPGCRTYFLLRIDFRDTPKGAQLAKDALRNLGTKRAEKLAVLLPIAISVDGGGCSGGTD